jgi:hypothetical protein
MRQREDINCGKLLSPSQVWEAYRDKLNRALVASVHENRLRDGIAPTRDDGASA